MASKQSQSTLIAVCVAAVWILALHGIIVFWAMTEPASIERRLEAGQKTAQHVKTAAKTETAGDSPATSTEADGSRSASSETTKPFVPANPTLGWAHVAFPAVLLGSCVAIFGILIWAAVMLNREFV